MTEQLNHHSNPMKTDGYIRTSSCLECKPCGNDCTIVNNRISFITDSEKKRFSHLLLDSAPKACMGRCGKSCQAALHLVQEVKHRTIPAEQLKIINI